MGIWLDILYYTFTIVYSVVAAGLVVVIVLENRNPIRTLAWILLLVLFPLVGIVVYLFFGRDYRSRKIMRPPSEQVCHTAAASDLQLERAGIPEQFRKVYRLLDNEMRAPLYAGNRVEVYTTGQEIFDTMFADLEQARRSINIEFYIIEEGNVGARLHDILTRAAARGVEVRIIFDYIGGLKLPIEWRKSLGEAGVKIYPFLSTKGLAKLQFLNYRNHRKIVVIDGEKAYTGGVNIADRYRLGNHLGLWRDTFIRVTGPGVAGLQQAFFDDWNFVDKEQISLQDYLAASEPLPDGETLQVITSGPDNDWQNMLNGIISAINNARERVYIHTPYFIPPEPLVQALESAALSGVDVRLMMAEQSDSLVVTTAGRSYVDKMLSAGMRVYFYRFNFLHSKAIVVDGRLSIIGTANMDVRSFEQNFELAAFVYGRRTGATLERNFEQDMLTCRELNLTAWRHRTLWRHITESVARLFSPIF